MASKLIKNSQKNAIRTIKLLSKTTFFEKYAIRGLKFCFTQADVDEEYEVPKGGGKWDRYRGRDLGLTILLA